MSTGDPSPQRPSVPPGDPEGPARAPHPSRAPTPSVAPGAPARGRRPRYLLVALLGAILFGAECWTSGCSRLSLYRGEQTSMPTSPAIHDDVSRAHLEELYQRFIEVADSERRRGIPLAAATFVLGAALLMLSARGLSGRPSARSALLQVVAVQAALVCGTHYAMRQTRGAELDWLFEHARVEQEERLKPEEYRQGKVAEMLHATRVYGIPGWLAFRTLASALIVVALTRPRSRAFFEAAREPLSEGSDT